MSRHDPTSPGREHAMRAAVAESSGRSIVAGGTASNRLRHERGVLALPLHFPVRSGNAIIARNFNQRRGPQHARRRHHGVDIWGVPVGTAIEAATAGTVRAVYTDRSAPSGFGIAIDHDGLRFYYFHMVRIPTFAVGNTVRPGLTLGGVGSTGRSDGPHLHFGVMDIATGTYLDPTSALRRAFDSAYGVQRNV